MRIYKYDLLIKDVRFQIKLPLGAKILTIQIQGGHPRLWAIVDETLEPTETRELLIIATGDQMPEVGRYITTFQIHDGAFVWHVFEAPIKNLIS